MPLCAGAGVGGVGGRGCSWQLPRNPRLSLGRPPRIGRPLGGRLVRVPEGEPDGTCALCVFQFPPLSHPPTPLPSVGRPCGYMAPTHCVASQRPQKMGSAGNRDTCCSWGLKGWGWCGTGGAPPPRPGTTPELTRLVPPPPPPPPRPRATLEPTSAALCPACCRKPPREATGVSGEAGRPPQSFPPHRWWAPSPPHTPVPLGVPQPPPS